MVSSKQCLAKFGEPSASNKCMTLWDVPTELEIGIIPKRIYCNRLMVEPLKKAFKNLIDTGAVKELKTWDGCFNIRKKRGLSTMSLHSWGLAIDVNAFENGLNMPGKLSPTFIKCFKDAGFVHGGDWLRKDCMHFELASL